ncbi:MAG: alanine--tRNA ligase [Pygmaiobacter massiliensis]|nr:alanine--tRNA ligase [Pygmaiobacter massiliensis]
MKWTGLNELREEFLSFFEEKGHLRLESFPLVPKNDNSLLLINSGMAPMKKWFLAEEEPPRHRVCTCQKCIRTPDIERVGITARHGTFFEMLGNFSFQDYFKKEAIAWAWEFLTGRLAIPAEKLYISVYQDDDEAWDIWTKQIGIPEDHMVRFGKEDNFWEHGSGPCGPCSEIYFDRGPEYGCGKPGCAVGCDCDRYMEVWNLVFSQFDSDGAGTYTRMARPNIDTGMGLERLACVMQGVGNLFEVDTVRSTLNLVEKISGKSYGQNHKDDISIRVITDHIRSTTFMVSDGILPSNAGRGYVLRRLLRRAARHGRLLGIRRPFLTELVDNVIEASKAGYPELAEHADYIKKVIGTEEESFYKTIDQGMNILTGLLENIKKTAQEGKEKVLSGLDAFRLHDTFGFPLDLTKEIAAEAGVSVDEDTFQKELAHQRDTARADRRSKDISGWSSDLFSELEAEPTVFVGYDQLECDATVVALACEDGLTDAVSCDDGPKEGVLVVLDTTPFYAESGGQVGDVGYLTAEGVKLRVQGCKKNAKGYYVHTCVLESGLLTKGSRIVAAVDRKVRMATARNHTAAHLLQAALREVLGLHVHQAGSYEDGARVRFDFTHFGPVTPEELERVEKMVNEKIFEAIPVTTEVLPIKEAKQKGAMALFGEKYGDMVRVVSVSDYSTEFCGGTHVSNTAMVGSFKILSEAGVAAGVRRIEGVTGSNVLALLEERTELLNDTCEKLKVGKYTDLPLRIAGLNAELREMRSQLEKAKAAAASQQVDGLFQNAKEMDGIRIFTAFFGGTDTQTLRDMCDKIRESTPDSVIVLCGEANGKGNMAAAVGKGALARGVKAGNLVKLAAAVTGGKGGGKPDFAMAGVGDLTKVDEALAAVPELVKSLLN